MPYPPPAHNRIFLPVTRGATTPDASHVALRLREAGAAVSIFRSLTGHLAQWVYGPAILPMMGVGSPATLRVASPLTRR